MWVIEFFHVLFGILWIGLLYFFNMVQVQSMPKMTEAGEALVTHPLVRLVSFTGGLPGGRRVARLCAEQV